MRSLEPELCDSVFVRSWEIFGVITAKFYIDEVLNVVKINNEEADKNFPGWEKKPLYLILAYHPEENSGQKFIALHDILTLTSELN